MINAVTQRQYTGTNYTELEQAKHVKGYTSELFATPKQWASLGKRVKQGQEMSGTRLKFFKDEIDDGRAVKKLRYFWVMNADQVE